MVAVSSRASFVQETSTTTGTGTYDLAGAVTGFQGFVAGNGDGEVVRYSATNGTDWEVCEGTITDAGTDTLSRDTVLESSNGGAAVNWGAGTKTISQVITPGEVAGKFLIEEITLTSGAPGEFDFTSIPGVFNRLIIEGMLKSDTVSGVDAAHLFLNTDTTPANYHRQNILGNNGSGNTVEASNPQIATIADDSSSNVFTQLKVEIGEYRNPLNQEKTVLSWFLSQQSAGNLWTGGVGVQSSVTAAITRIRIRTDNHPTDQLYGTLRLYGEN